MLLKLVTGKKDLELEVERDRAIAARVAKEANKPVV